LHGRDPLVWFLVYAHEDDPKVIEAPRSTDHAALRIVARLGLLPPGWRWIDEDEYWEGAERDVPLVDVYPASESAAPWAWSGPRAS
jgi:hypothetical protein